MSVRDDGCADRRGRTEPRAADRRPGVPASTIALSQDQRDYGGRLFRLPRIFKMRLRFLLPIALGLSGALLFAQETVDEPAEQPGDEDRLAALFAEQEQRIEDHQRNIEYLQRSIDAAEGVTRNIFVARLDKANLELLDVTIRLAREVLEAQERGIEIGDNVDNVARNLESLPQAAFEAIAHVIERLDLDVDPETPGDLILADQQLAIDTAEVDQIYGAVIGYIEIAPAFDINTAEDRDRLTLRLQDSAENRSVFLEIANVEAAKLRAAVGTLPEDGDLKAWLAATEARESVASSSLEAVTVLMDRLELDTAVYRRQVIAATGEITTDVLDVGVLAGLLAEWTAEVRDVINTQGPGMIFSLLLANLLFLLFWQLGKIAQRVVAKALSTNRVNLSHLLQKMILSMVRNVILVIGVLVALSQIGISLGPLLAGLGIAGFIIGFALQDSLSNFVSGLMILVYRPFDVGDFVEVAGVKGQINTMSLVNTSFLTFDNQKLVVPNNMVWQSVITNYTAQETRRVDLEFGISYGDDIDKAEAIIREVLDGYETILEDPKPVIKVGTLGDSSVNLIVRPWVRTEDYWETYWDLTKLVKQAFDHQGITIPFPQQDVHHYHEHGEPAGDRNA